MLRGVSGDIDLGALSFVEDSVHELDLFFAERHTVASHFRIDTTLVLSDDEPVPEPSTIMLMLLGFLGLAGIRLGVKKR
jgi:hypothetical protein